MPIDPKRIEAAARALMSDWGSIDAPTEQELEYALDKARAVLAAGFPELASDPSTAWVAPIEPTTMMFEHGRDALRLPSPDHVYVSQHVQQIYRAMRDAYTKEQT